MGKRKDNISAGQGLKAPPREKDDADKQKNNMGYVIKPYVTILIGPEAFNRSLPVISIWDAVKSRTHMRLQL